jgi:hypothetical protein
MKEWKTIPNYSRYLRTMLKRDDGVIHTIKVHRIIAQTYIENPLGLSEIDHLNDIKDDNRVENLEWVSHQENKLRWKQRGCKGKLIGEQIGTAKLTENQVREIRAKFIPRVYGRKKLAEEYGVQPCTIKDIILKNSWTHLL